MLLLCKQSQSLSNCGLCCDLLHFLLNKIFIPLIAISQTFGEISGPSCPVMSGSIESLDQDGLSNKPSFMDIQQSLSLPQHQPYSSFRSSYTSTATPAHEAFAQVQSSRSLSGYPFSSMNNSPLHSAYSHHTGHSYLGSCGPCQPCPSPPREGKIHFQSTVFTFSRFCVITAHLLIT